MYLTTHINLHCCWTLTLLNSPLAHKYAQIKSIWFLAWHTQAQLASRRGRKAASAKQTPGAASATVTRPVCEQTDATCCSSRQDTEAPDAGAQSSGPSAECDCRPLPTKQEVLCKEKQEQSSQKSGAGDSTKAEGTVVQVDSDSSTAASGLVPSTDLKSIEKALSGTSNNVVDISVAADTGLQERLANVPEALIDKDKKLRKGCDADDESLNTVEAKGSRPRGD